MMWCWQDPGIDTDYVETMEAKYQNQNGEWTQSFA